MNESNFVKKIRELRPTFKGQLLALTPKERKDRVIESYQNVAIALETLSKAVATLSACVTELPGYIERDQALMPTDRDMNMLEIGMERLMKAHDGYCADMIILSENTTAITNWVNKGQPG